MSTIEAADDGAPIIRRQSKGFRSFIEQTSPSNNNRLPTTRHSVQMNYTSPQESLENALNFDNDNYSPTTNNNQQQQPAAASKTGGLQSKMKLALKKFISNLNDSTKVYPAVALIVFTVSLALVLFQQVSATVKLLLIILYLGFLVFTIMTFKNKQAV